MIHCHNLSRRYNEIKEEYLEYLNDIMQRESVFNNHYVNLIEKHLASTSNRKHALMTNTGSISLLLAVYAYDIGKGDEVIVTNYSCPASLSYILVAGATPVFCEVDVTGNMNTDFLSKLITCKTKAIVATGMYGDMHNHDAVDGLCKKHNIVYINDASQSMFAKYNNKESLSCGDIVTMSFSENKPLPAIGTSGAILTDNTELYYKLLHLRKHGKPYRKSPYTHFGVNGIPDEDKAAQILCSVNRFEKWQNKRKQIVEYYDKEFSARGVEIRDHQKEWNTHKYAIMFDDKFTAQAELKKLNIETEAHYADCLGPAMPNSQMLVKRSLTIPCNAHMTDAEIEQVVNKVEETWKKKNI